jgi:nucleoside-diphosphate-sugar epimerase
MSIHSDSTILITGALGFIGTNLALRLLKNNKKVVGVDNQEKTKSQNLQYLEKFSNFTLISSSIENPQLHKLLKPYSIKTIYHLACPTGVPNLITQGLEMLSACSIGTQNILDIALEKKASFLFSSSSEVYGNPEKFPQTEEYTGNVDPIGIRSPYEEGKRFSEALIMQYVRKYNLDAKIVRIFNTYGPYYSKTDLRVIPLFIEQSLKEAGLTIHGDGSQARTFLYIDDLIEGLLLIMNQSQPGGVFNLGSEKPISVLNLAKMILEISSSKSPIVHVPRPEHDPKTRLPSLEKIKKLGWQENISLKQGLSLLLKKAH